MTLKINKGQKMALPRQKFREIVFQILFCSNYKSSSDEDIISLILQQFSASEKEVVAALDMAKDIDIKIQELDACISKTSTSYQLDRIQNVEHNILRLGFYELLYSDVPRKVVIAEAVRLCKKFSTPEATSFINAILDSEHISKFGD